MYFPDSTMKSAGSRVVEASQLAEAGRVDRVDARRPIREVESEAPLVAVPGHLTDDLAEAERDDREVVASEPKCRQADDDAACGSDAAAMSSTSQIEMCMPPSPGGTPTAPKEKLRPNSVPWGEANHAAVYAPSA